MSCIPSDPDISGLGVRIAIYIQNLLSFIPAMWALSDGKVELYELESIETQSTTILITAFAILISAMVQAQTLGLSSFHAAIVLGLSWMNNTNTFIYFLLYIQHKSQHGPDQVKPEWSSWIAHVRKRLWLTAAQIKESKDEESLGSNNPANLNSLERRQKHGDTEHQQQLWIKNIFKRIVLFLGSLHLSIMAALGIWLWSGPGSFGHLSPCVAASIAVLGNHIPLSSKGLHGGSLMIYSLFLTPGLNLVVPMGVFLGLYIYYQAWHRKHSHNSGSNPSTMPIVISMVILLAINIIFLVDIELTLQQNQHLQEDSDESSWTFGQILALLLLVVPLRDLLEAILARREKRHREEDTTLFKNAILTEKMEVIQVLVEKGVDVNVKVEDQENRTITALQLASYKEDVRLVTMLLNNGADPNAKGNKYGTALEITLRAGKVNIMKLLVEKGANMNVQVGEDGTALQVALLEGKLDIVELLLERGADPNVQGGQYGTALQAASLQGNLDIVKLLVEKGADMNVQGGEYGTALQAALSAGNLDIVKLLVEKGANPNVQGGFYGTALQAALLMGNLDIVKLLVEKGADINAQGGKYGTALQAASSSWRGNLDIVQLLLENGADINAQGGKHGTALQAASSAGNLDIVKLLLEKGASFNIEGQN
ncbi:multiple ankyrin repeats single kh domain [Moniliophthora roreri]|nr:multiple ankyrin repeats single kh domain [Moniliophthora roreri]